MNNIRVGVVNPYALAELSVGKRIDWDNLSDPDGFLCNILQSSKDDIFNLKKSPILNPHVMINSTGEIEILSEANARARVADYFTNRSFQPFSGLAYANRTTDSAREAISLAVYSAKLKSNTQWEPANVEWVDKGDYFEDVSEFNDPIQGALGDCYFIAALSSVAWSRPYAIVNMIRPSAWGDDDAPIHSISFYKNGSGEAQEIEVSEKVPVAMVSQQWKYARSLDLNEIWPAVMEKAYAKWKSGNSTDQPDYRPLAGGDPVRACAELIGGRRKSKNNATTSSNNLWGFVRSNSLSRRTINPMVAWTHPESPSGLNYNTANVIANHAYSILGWDYRNGVKYIILRNPWGTKHATLDTRSGTWNAYQVSHWAGIPLNRNGVFAMAVDTYKKYFRGTGCVR